MTWVCDIPGANAATVAFHFWLHAGLLAAVLAAGTAFLVLAVIAYRRPLDPAGEDTRLAAAPD